MRVLSPAARGPAGPTSRTAAPGQAGPAVDGDPAGARRWRSPATARSGEGWALAVAALLALATGLAFLPALGCDFVAYDDPRGSPQYAILLGGLSLESVAWALGETDFFANWLPLTLLSHLLDWELWGERAAGHHLTSVLLHAGTTALVFLLWRRATGRPWRALAVAVLWGIHPLRVEPVVWVAARKDVLSGFFALLALLLYVGWARQPSRRRYLAVAAALACGLLAKSMVMTLPAVMLLLDAWPLRRLPLAPGRSEVGAEGVARRWGRRAAAWWRAAWPLLREKLPLFALAAAVGAVAFFTQQQGGAMGDLAARPLPSRLAVAALAVPRYLAAMLWPADLMPFYPLPLGPPDGGRAGLAGLVVLAITAATLAGARRAPWACCGWLWFLGMLLPVSGIVQVGEASHADRYTYLPSIGLLVAVVWGVAEAAARWRVRRALLVSGTAAIALAAALATWAAIAPWRGSSSLFAHMLAIDPDNHMAHLNSGLLRAREGRLDAAIAHYRAALAARPDLAMAHNNVGLALRARGDEEAARQAFLAALRVDPGLAGAHFNLAVLYADRDRGGLAVAHLAMVVHLQPDYGPAWQGLAELLARPGVAEQARPHVESLRRREPGSAPLRRVAALLP